VTTSFPGAAALRVNPTAPEIGDGARPWDDVPVTEGAEGLAAKIAELVGDRQVITAESCTAGRVAEALATAEHAVDFLRGGLVAYQDEIKRNFLGVTAESTISAEAAEEMASGACRTFGADIAVSTTGVAGDEPHDGELPGTVYIAVAVDGDVGARKYRFEGAPDEVCERARVQALADLRDALTGTR
jgi:nicotinamide-nucleotide amidase